MIEPMLTTLLYAVVYLAVIFAICYLVIWGVQKAGADEPVNRIVRAVVVVIGVVSAIMVLLRIVPLP